MNSFFERKQEYFDRLYENPKLIQSIINKEKNKNNSNLGIIFNPNTENELIVADSFFTLLQDVNQMTYSYDVCEPDYEHNFFLHYMNQIIAALQQRDMSQIEFIGEELQKQRSPEFGATLYYDMLRVFLYDFDAALNFLSERNHSSQFAIYFQHANAILNSYLDNPLETNMIDFESTSLVEFIQQFVQVFDSFYQEDFKKIKDNVKNRS